MANGEWWQVQSERAGAPIRHSPFAIRLSVHLFKISTLPVPQLRP